jgi:AraC-like DNA-binding protein
VREEAHFPHLTVRRLWLPAAPAVRDAEHAAGGLFAALQAEGHTIMDTHSYGRVVLPEGSVVVVPRREIAALSSTTATARIEIETGDHGPIRFDASAGLLLHPEMSDVFSATILANAAIGLMNETKPQTAAAETHLEAALLSLVGALVCEIAAHRRESEVTADSDTLIRSALTLIDRHAGEPGLTVESVASDLQISTRHLARVFRRYHLSPKTAISERRMLSARLLLAVDPGRPLVEVSRASGFASTGALRYHLDRAWPADDADVSGAA